MIYKRNPKTCKHCGKIIPYAKRENDYCNSSCFASENNKGVCRNKLYYDTLRGKSKSTRTKRVSKRLDLISCKFCGEQMQPTRKWVEFCNNKKCSILHETAELIRKGLATRHNKRRVKFYLIETRGHKCEDCKLTKWRKWKIPLEIHHIDGDVDNMALGNIKLVCPNCHTFTDTYKFKNHIKKNNGGCRSGQTDET
jgi:hypothetical protein